MTTKSKNEVSVFQAIEASVKAIDALLVQMKQPINTNNPERISELRGKMKLVLKDIIVGIQRNLLLNNTNGAGLLATDPVGFTKAKTSYSSAKFLKTNPHGAIVDQLCSEILEEQKAASINNGMVVSEQQIINAQNDSKDETKDHIELESADGNSTLRINKENGDTEVYEKDKETGELVKVGFFKQHWKNVKDFCINIWNWCKEKCIGFVNWVKSFFTTPDDQDVIIDQAA